MQVFHYTSIQALALILEDKRLLFNRLSQVDDMQEGKVKGFESISDYIYVSSWTQSKKENIALWSMYSKNHAGVRLELTESAIKVNNDKVGVLANVKAETLNVYSLKYNGLVKYVPEAALEAALIEQIDNKNLKLKENEIGMLKSDLWAFQEEYRFRILGVPKNNVNETSSPYLNDILYMLRDKPKNKETELYVDIPKKAFQNMSVLLGPKTTKADRIIVESLVKDYIPNFNGKIEKSILEIR